MGGGRSGKRLPPPKKIKSSQIKVYIKKKCETQSIFNNKMYNFVLGSTLQLMLTLFFSEGLNLGLTIFACKLILGTPPK